MSRASDDRHRAVRGAAAGCGDPGTRAVAECGEPAVVECGGCVWRCQRRAFLFGFRAPYPWPPTNSVNDRAHITTRLDQDRRSRRRRRHRGVGSRVGRDAGCRDTGDPAGAVGSARRDRRAGLHERDLHSAARALLPEIQLRLSRAVGRLRRLSLRIPRLHGRKHIRARPFRASRRGKRDSMRITCDRFVWAGGQENAPGKLDSDPSSDRFDDRVGRATSRWSRPIKTVTTIVRGVPRGRCHFGGGGFPQQRTTAKAWSDIRSAAAISTRRRSMATPLAHDSDAIRRLLRLVARRPRAAEALLSRAGRHELSCRSDLRTRCAGETTIASQIPTWRLGHESSADEAVHAAHGASRTRVRAPGVGDPSRRARTGCATSRW